MLRHLLIVSAAAITSMPPLQVASADVKPTVATSGAVQLAVIPDQLLAHREELVLDDRQIRGLESLAAEVRHQESDWYDRAERCATSKPWLRGPCLASVTQVRSAALAILRPDQRPLALTVLAASANRG